MNQTLAEAVAILADRVRDGERGRLKLQVSGPQDPLVWLHGAGPFRRFYFRSREGIEYLGVGVTEEVTEVPTAVSEWWIGGMRFDPTRQPDAPWGAFGVASFVRPALRVQVSGESSLIELDVDDPSATLALLTATPGPCCHGDKGLQLPPDRASWIQAVDGVLGHIRDSETEKVVLSRRWSLASRLDPWRLVGELPRSIDGYRFGFTASSGDVFLGAPPERLFQRKGPQVRTEAVAGTALAGAPPEALLTSRKNTLEHSVVQNDIRAAVEPLCVSLQWSPLDVLVAGGVQHLVRRAEGILRDGVTDAALLAALHPTPAVCGKPTDEARQLIAILEPEDRGWYSGPFGVVHPEGCDFAVAIRSAVVGPGWVHAYAGAGIVQGSDPNLEWEEIHHKVSPFLQAGGAP